MLLVLAGAFAPAGSYAFDEIQVYNAEIADIGQWTAQQHLNYAFAAPKESPFPGGFPPNHALNGTPEFAYGVTKWFELGWYLPFAVRDNRFLSNGGKIRTLFVVPNAADRNFFYGINFEFAYGTPPFAQSLFNIEARPIIGVRNTDWEFIINPIVDFATGRYGEADFVPAARVARKLDKDFYIGVEYYGDYGKIGNFAPPSQQQQLLFAVTDFKLGMFDIDFGLGFGLTSGSDQMIAKTIISYAFPAPGAKSDTEGGQGGALMTPRSMSRARRDNQFSATSMMMQ